MCSTQAAAASGRDWAALSLSQRPTSPNAGFWIRFAATGIDGIVVFSGVLAAVHVAGRAGLYLPLESSSLVALALSSSLLLGWKGSTLGKALCGLNARTLRGKPVGFGRALWREAVGKLVSTICLLVGFLWVLTSKDKRAWHDHLAGTIVVQDSRALRRARITLAAVLAGVAVVVGLYIRELAQAYRLVRSMAPAVNVTPPYFARDPSTLTEVSELGDHEKVNIAEWIDEHGRAPLEYAVVKAIEHQVVIFGEVHEQDDNLRFLNELIPALHRRAGVQCVAMEVCLAEDNAEIERLVTASDFDHDLAMEIARHQPWGLWRWKGYWDVFQTVWRLNQTIPKDEPKIRVIGLDWWIDLPSMAMVGFEDRPVRGCPPWEKLRVFRVIRTLPRALARDAFMAAQIEQEIIEKGQHGIVWVGRNHSSIGCPQPGPPGGWSRMGFMLHQRHGAKIFQIRLHGKDLPAALVDPTYAGPGPMMADFLESAMRVRQNRPVGFDVAPSPVARLRDANSFDFHLQPRLGFADVAAGYVFLAPWRDMKTCEWLDGYISPRMFTANKPFYQAFGRRAGVEVSDAREANELFALLDD